MVVEPRHEVEVIGIASEAAHGDMGVAVDETREESGVAEIPNGLVGVTCEDIGALAEIGDGGARDDKSGIAEDVARCVLSEEVSGGIDHGDRLRGECGCIVYTKMGKKGNGLSE